MLVGVQGAALSQLLVPLLVGGSHCRMKLSLVLQTFVYTLVKFQVREKVSPKVRGN